MYINDDLRELCKINNDTSYKEVNECISDIIDNMRKAALYGIDVVSTERVGAYTDSEHTEVKITVPKDSYIKVDGVVMAGKDLARWYKDCLKRLVISTVNISEFTTGENMLKSFSREEIDEILDGVYTVKAKIRDEEWTEDKAKERERIFNNDLDKAIKEAKEDEDFIEI